MEKRGLVNPIDGSCMTIYHPAIHQRPWPEVLTLNEGEGVAQYCFNLVYGFTLRGIVFINSVVYL